MGITTVVNICQCRHAVFQTVSTAGDTPLWRPNILLSFKFRSVAISYTYKIPKSLQPHTPHLF